MRYGSVSHISACEGARISRRPCLEQLGSCVRWHSFVRSFKGVVPASGAPAKAACTAGRSPNPGTSTLSGCFVFQRLYFVQGLLQLFFLMHFECGLSLGAVLSQVSGRRLCSQLRFTGVGGISRSSIHIYLKISTSSKQYT